MAAIGFVARPDIVWSARPLPGSGLRLLLHLVEGQGVELDLLDHGQQTVRACGGEVLAQAYAVYEVEVGVEYFAGRVSAEHAQQQRHYAFHYQGVGVGAEDHLAVLLLSHDPYAALAALDQILGRFLAFRHLLGRENSD